MALWLLKTEPSAYSFARLRRDKQTRWDGVKNPAALRNLGQMKQGDRLFIYHTGAEKAVVGTATVLGAPYPDPKKNDPRLLVVDIAADTPLQRPVTLAEIKASPQFRGWDLVRLPRLSVLPVTAAHWAEIERMAGT
jgi:predicted RNA-binding protein with PUA-like domain